MRTLLVAACIALVPCAGVAHAGVQPSPASDPNVQVVVTSQGSSTKPVWIEAGQTYPVSKKQLRAIANGTATRTPGGAKIVSGLGSVQPGTTPNVYCCDPGGDTCGQYQGYNNGGSWLNPDHVWNTSIVCWNQGGPPAGSGNWQISGVGGWADTRPGISRAVCFTQWWAFWEAYPWQAVSRAQAGFAPIFHDIPLCPANVVITASLRAYWSPGYVTGA